VFDPIGEDKGEILKGNPAFFAHRGHELVGSKPELAGPLAGE
jgi:hypothetical protein